MEYQTMAQRKQLAQHLVGRDHKNNRTKNPEVRHIVRLLVVSFLVLLAIKVPS